MLQEFFDPSASVLPDVTERPSTLADHDALLGIALDDHVGLDVDLLSVFIEGLHLDRDRIG